jgi:hypothetical protein
MKNPNGPSIEQIEDWHDAQQDEERAELSRVTGQLRELHKKAEAAAWSAVDDGRGDGAFKGETMEAFNTAAWNSLPWILDKLDETTRSARALAINAGSALKFAKKAKEELRKREAMGIDFAEECDVLSDAATHAYNAINSTMQTLLACDHVSMLRHPQIVDGLHQALNGLKRALHQNAADEPPAAGE